MVKLSRTEVTVGELYFKQGLKPREIAQRLGISINTVYKAISKYKSAMANNGGEAEDLRQGNTHIQQWPTQTAPMVNVVFTFSVAIPQSQHVDYMPQYLNKIEPMLKELIDEVRLIKSELREVKELMSKAPLNAGKNMIEVLEQPPGLPSFVRDNIWVDIIRSRQRGF